MIENVITQVRPTTFRSTARATPACRATRRRSAIRPRLRGRSASHVATGDRGARRRSVHALFRRGDSEVIRLHPEWGVVNATARSTATRPLAGAPTRTSCCFRSFANWRATTAWTGSGLTASAGPRCLSTATPRFRHSARRQGLWMCRESLASHTGSSSSIPSGGVPQVPAILHRRDEEDPSGLSDLQQLAFTDHMPEPVCAPLDFLSGDYNPTTASNPRALGGTCAAGRAWDLLAWSSPEQDRRRAKSEDAVQLQGRRRS